ncbi:MAG: hypothetical protein A2Z35_01075 [Actinobacteria bacterium RBG_19FT_COMBO_36_27]|nr:MAG: hypothetical protein A2Z35_01075 [Actinobacteria bacterium RBG_19FT_COMBO_36_27]
MEKISLNRYSKVPLHKQISNVISSKIESGELKPGETIPSVLDMQSLLGVSTIVIRQSYEFLRRAGLIVTQQGKGSFVTEKNPSFEFIQKIGSSFKEAKEKGEKITTSVLELKEINEVDNYVKEKLKLGQNDTLIKITRLRAIREIKMFYWTSYLPASTCRLILTQDLVNESLYQILKEKLGLNIIKAERFVEVVKADSRKAEILDIPELEPLFFIESLSYTENNSPIEYYQGWYDTRYTKFYFEIK